VKAGQCSPNLQQSMFGTNKHQVASRLVVDNLKIKLAEMDHFRLPSSVDFHLPSSMVGASFIWSKEKGIFDAIKANIAIYYTGPIDLIKLMAIVDSVDQTAGLGHTESMKILGNVMAYLRIKLLSRDLRITEMTAVLLDVLVKNCQYRIHIYVGRRIFMKTFCLVLRQLLVDEREQHRSAGKMN
jgi:hypothetical protein